MNYMKEDQHQFGGRALFQGSRIKFFGSLKTYFGNSYLAPAIGDLTVNQICNMNRRKIRELELPLSSKQRVISGFWSTIPALSIIAWASDGSASAAALSASHISTTVKTDFKKRTEHCKVYARIYLVFHHSEEQYPKTPLSAVLADFW